jgi:Tfp pilus assembly protein PilN
MVNVEMAGISGSPGIVAGDAIASARRPDKDSRSGQVLECVAALFDELGGLFAGNSKEAQLVVIQKQEDVDIFFAKKPGKFDRIDTLPAIPDANCLTGLSRKLGRVPADKIVLRIASDRAIRKVVSLPSSALSFLPSIVRNKVDSLSPWRSADMLWGYRLIDGSAGDGNIAIEIGMTGREPVKTLASSLKVAGINVGRIEFGDSASSENNISAFSATPERSQRETRKVLLVAIALGALSVLTGLTGVLQTWTTQKELQSISGESEKLQAMMNERSAADGQMTEVSAALALAARKRHDVPFIVLLKELTLSIPDSNWLQAVNFSEERLIISGKGGPVSPIITALENSPLFQDVNFAAATQRSLADKQDSFSISANVSSAIGDK